MLGCKKFLTYKRKRLTANSHAHGNGCPNLVSVPKETPLCDPDLCGKLVGKSPLEDETGNFSSSRLEAKKDVEESTGKGTSTDNCLENKSCHPRLDSSSSCCDDRGDNEDIEWRFGSYSTGTSAIIDADCIGEKPSSELKISFESQDNFSMSKTTSMEIAKENPTVGVAAEVTKFRAPLITFFRRCRRKRNTEIADVQNKSLIDDTKLSTVTKRSRVACDSTILRESDSEKGGSVDDAMNLKPSTEVRDTSDIVCQIENKIPEVVPIRAQIEPSLHAKVLVFEREEPQDDQSVSKDVLHENEEVHVRNDQIGHQDLSTGSLGVSLNENVKDPSSKDEEAGKLAKGNESEREKSQAILNDGLTAAVEGSCQLLDLSITPTNSSGTMECHAYLESNSKQKSVHAVTETLLGSLDSTSRSHAAISRQMSPLEVFVEGPNTNCEDNNKASFRPHDFMSRNKCLQLFAEERTEDSDRSVFTQPEVTNPVRRKSPPFLGLALPRRSKTTRFASNFSFSTFPFLNSIDETPQPFEETLPQSSASHLSSLLRHKSMLDGIVNRARALSERDVFQDKLKLYSSAWTEEELDSLWVGVRRYGRDNWNAMIRDPRLRFSSWRVARELAEQWEEEQSKLFQRAIPLPLQHAKAKGVSLGFSSRRETTAEETRLSLGDVYNLRERKVSRRAKFKSAYPRSGDNSYLQRPGKNPYLDYQGESYKDEGSNCFRGRTMPKNNPSSTIGPTTFMAAEGNNLPHWLREAVFCSASSHREPPSVPVVSSVAHPHMMQPTWAYVDHYELQLGRSNGMHHLGSGLRRSDLLISDGGHNNLNHSSGKNRVADVIVIDSDASSEETISDDHCGRS